MFEHVNARNTYMTIEGKPNNLSRVLVVETDLELFEGADDFSEDAFNGLINAGTNYLQENSMLFDSIRFRTIKR